jgi:hypothetical protein
MSCLTQLRSKIQKFEWVKVDENYEEIKNSDYCTFIFSMCWWLMFCILSSYVLFAANCYGYIINLYVSNHSLLACDPEDWGNTALQNIGYPTTSMHTITTQKTTT